MSDFKFLHNPALNQTFSGSVSGDIITLSSGTFDTGDAIHINISDTVGVYAYCTNGANRTFKFDSGIYENIPSTITNKTGEYWEGVSDLIYDDVNSYRISASVDKGLYSQYYLSYKTSVDYSLIISAKKREFFNSTPNKSVKDLVLSSNIIFTDDCKEVAYKVSFSEDEFDFFNNKFKSSLTFNIAKR